MNIKEITKIINSELNETAKEWFIMQILAEDDKIIPTLLSILETERKSKKELLEECNLMLSKAHLGLEQPITNSDGFMQKEIREFYNKNKGKIGHCFINLDKK